MRTMWWEQTTVERLRENAIRSGNGLQVALHTQTTETPTEHISTGVQIRVTWYGLKMPANLAMISSSRWFHNLISSLGEVFISTHQWVPCSWCPRPYFWERWPRHKLPCHCLSSVTPPGWEGLSLYAQQPGCTLTTDREKARRRLLHSANWQL